MLVKILKPILGQTEGAVVDVPDEEAKTLIKKGIAEPASDDVLSPILAKATESLMGKLNDSLTAVVEATLKRFAETQEQSKKFSVPAIFGTGKEGDPKKNFPDWLRHAVVACTGKGKEAWNAADYMEKTYQQKAAMAEGAGVTGGYAVPEEFASSIMSLVSEESILRPRATVVPMGSVTMQLPYIDVLTAQSAGASAFFGGMQAAWTAEAVTRTEYEPTFRTLELKAWELSAYSISSNVLLQDGAAMGLEKFLMSLFAKVIAWTEEYAFFQGNGAGKPLGIINAPALISTTRTTAARVKYADIANMISRLLPNSFGRAIWVCHPYVLADLIQLVDASNQVVWVNNMAGATEKTPGQLFGRPVYISEKLPALGTKGDILLIDPSLYVIGDRMSLEIAASEHVNFLKNQMTWRVVERVDGQPWVGGTTTLADASSTVSPFVAIAT